MQVYGVDAIIRIVSHLAFIYLAFWALPVSYTHLTLPTICSV